jgi:hypothetical protein
MINFFNSDHLPIRLRLPFRLALRFVSFRFPGLQQPFAGPGSRRVHADHERRLQHHLLLRSNIGAMEQVDFPRQTLQL